MFQECLDNLLKKEGVPTYSNLPTGGPSASSPTSSRLVLGHSGQELQRTRLRLCEEQLRCEALEKSRDHFRQKVEELCRTDLFFEEGEGGLWGMGFFCPGEGGEVMDIESGSFVETSGRIH